MKIIFTSCFLFLCQTIFSQQYYEQEYDTGPFGPSPEMNYNPVGGLFIIPITILIILLLGYFGLSKKMMVNRKRDKALQIIFDANRYDKFWNKYQMANIGKTAFEKYYLALNKKDFSLVSDISATKLKQKFDITLSKDQRNKVERRYELKKMRQCKIIFAQAEKKDFPDEFRMFYEGTFEVENQDLSTKESSRVINPFKHIFVFSRDQNEWKLSKVIDDATYSEIKRYYQKTE